MSRPLRRSLGLLLVTLGLAAPASGDETPFARVRPILVDRCLSCHAESPRKGGLDLSRRASALAGGESGEILITGKPEESLLLDKVAAGEMPPKSPLAAEEVAIVRDWIAAGAPYDAEPLAARRAGPDWWSLQPIRRPALPDVNDSSQVLTPVDRFVQARLEAAGLRPAPEADRRTLIRRVSFDLTGLPPTPAEIDDFVNDPAPDAYERLVDRLLASPRHGERWARHWLDVVRFAESHGYETNQLRPNAWPYRDYVIRAFNEDLPFARFVRDQLAADTDPGADWLTQAATGFLVGGVHDVVGNQTVEGMRQQRADDLDDMITATATAFLGLTVNCARCHDHKFDPIRQADYYGLAAVFAGVRHEDRDLPAPDAERRRRERSLVEEEIAQLDRRLDETEPLAGEGAGSTPRPPVNARRNVERFLPTAARFVRFTVLATGDGIEPCLDELEVYTAGESPRNIAPEAVGVSASSEYPNAAIHKIAHVNDRRHGNGRSWISAEKGAGWIELDLGRPAEIDRIVWGRDREQKYRDRLATDYRVEVATEPGQWHLIASSSDRHPYGSDDEIAQDPDRNALQARRDELAARLATLGDTIRVYAGTFAQPGPTHLLRRGDPMQEAEEVPPSAVRSVRPPLEIAADAPEQARRLALADWIAHADNPLPARVLVNRLWHYHFGRGLVATPSDFGFQGATPTHPELLDWLAAEFLAGGGRMKPIHRLIVLSAAYRRSGREDSRAEEIDASNALVWRREPQRLEAEALRDAMLAVAGTLDARMGGPGYNVWEENTNYVVVFTPRAELGPDTFRRMVYQFRPRSRHDPTFGAFDCPDAALVAPRRDSSTTALQALNLLNSRFVVAQAARFADRLRREAGDEPDAQGARAFRLAFGRSPSDGERNAAADLIRRHGAAAFCRAVFNANEFLYVD